MGAVMNRGQGDETSEEGPSLALEYYKVMQTNLSVKELAACPSLFLLELYDCEEPEIIHFMCSF